MQKHSNISERRGRNGWNERQKNSNGNVRTVSRAFRIFWIFSSRDVTTIKSKIQTHDDGHQIHIASQTHTLTHTLTSHFSTVASDLTRRESLVGSIMKLAIATCCCMLGLAQGFAPAHHWRLSTTQRSAAAAVPRFMAANGGNDDDQVLNKWSRYVQYQNGSKDDGRWIGSRIGCHITHEMLTLSLLFGPLVCPNSTTQQ